MTKLILSAKESKKLFLDPNGKDLHSNLKNLGFDESGHIGFQKELSAEQLQAINNPPTKVSDLENDEGYLTASDSKIVNLDARIGDNEDDITDLQDFKEDKTNKVTIVDDYSTDEQYASAKAIYDFVGRKVDWELIESVTLEQNTNSIIRNLNKNYKSIYIKVEIPTLFGVLPELEKSRVNIFINDLVVHCNNSPEFTDNKATWGLSYELNMNGNICQSFRTFTNNIVYSRYEKSWTDIALNNGVKLETPYINSFKFMYFSANNIMYLPAGTKYDLWGVRA